MFEQFKKIFRIRRKAVEPVQSSQILSYSWPGISIARGVAEPRRSLNVADEFDIAERVTELRTILLNRHNEVWRQELEIVNVEGVKDPNPDERARAERFSKSCNQFDQPIQTVLETAGTHTDITDDPWIWVKKDYQFDGTSPMAAGWNPETVEFYNGSPAVMRWSLDKDGRPARTWVRCPVHAKEIKDFDPVKAHTCPVRDCGRLMLPVWAVRKKGEGGGAPNEQFFIKGEVWHDSFFKGGEDNTWYGLSPIVSLYDKADTLASMEANDLDLYKNLEFPDVLYSWVTDNPEAMLALLNQQRAEQEESGKRKPLLVFSQPSSMTKGVKYGLEVTSLIAQTFQYQLDRSKELRERMAGLYQVPPLLMGSTDGMGGLNTQGAQREVMSAGGDALKNFLKKPAAFIFKTLGLKTVKIWFPAALKEDEERELKMQQLRLQNLQIVIGMRGRGHINAQGDAEIPEQDIGGTEPAQGQPGVTPPAPAAVPFGQGKDDFDTATKYAGQQPVQRAEKDLYDDLMDIFEKKWAELKIPKDYYKADTKKAVDAKITEIIASMHDHSKASLDKAFWDGIKAVEVQDAFAFRPGQRDVVALVAIHTDKDGILEGLKNYDTAMRETIYKVIEEHYRLPEREFSTSAMMQSLRQAGLDLAKHRLENIARTEGQHASNLGKLEAWKQTDPDNENKYEWSNPDDHRTTPICHNLVARTNRAKGGTPATMPELEKMMDEEIEAYKAQLRADHPTWKLDFSRRGLTPWYQCRGTPIRAVL